MIIHGDDRQSICSFLDGGRRAARRKSDPGSVNKMFDYFTRNTWWSVNCVMTTVNENTGLNISHVTRGSV